MAEFDTSYQYETWGWAAPVVRQWVLEAQKDLPLPSDGQDASRMTSFCKLIILFMKREYSLARLPRIYVFYFDFVKDSIYFNSI